MTFGVRASSPGRVVRKYFASRVVQKYFESETQNLSEFERRWRRNKPEMAYEASLRARFLIQALSFRKRAQCRLIDDADARSRKQMNAHGRTNMHNAIEQAKAIPADRNEFICKSCRTDYVIIGKDWAEWQWVKWVRGRIFRVSHCQTLPKGGPSLCLKRGQNNNRPKRIKINFFNALSISTALHKFTRIYLLAYFLSPRHSCYISNKLLII